MIDYLFVDPFNSKKSGVTEYIKNSALFLQERGYKVVVFSKSTNEEIDFFRKRLARYVDDNWIHEIEAPETQACTLYVNHPNIHIRLHLSKQLGNYLQSLKVNYKALENEQKVINSANYISAPSFITKIASKDLFVNLNKTIVYPNSIPRTKAFPGFDSSLQKRKLFFIGRGERLKGVFFLSVFKYFEDELICIGDRHLEFFLRGIKSRARYVSGDNKENFNLISAGDIIIILSGFETWSMVGSESLLKRCFVVTWKHLGFCEFFDNPFLKKVRFGDEEAFIQEVNTLLNENIDFCDISLQEDIDRVNYLFMKGILEKKSVDMECLPSYPKEEIIKKMKRSFFILIKAKLKKLYRNPYKFFVESSFYHKLVSKLMGRG